jgi:uncharacterized protein YbjT (DUF2867 family)
LADKDKIMTKVLIAGATGYLGEYLVKECKKRGYYTIGLTRDLHKLDHLQSWIDETKVAEVTQPHTLKNIFKGVDYVISSIGITQQKDGLTYMDVDYQANMNLLKESVSTSVKKFVYVSVLNADRMPDLKIIQAKEKFVRELQSSGLNYAIIRPNGFFSDMKELLEMARKGTIWLFGNGKYKGNPIHGADLAEVCVKSLSDGKKEVKVGGPEILIHNQMAEMAFKALEKKPKIHYVPVWLTSASIRILRILTASKFYGPLEFFMTVMTMDMEAPCYGSHKLGDFFKECAI